MSETEFYHTIESGDSAEFKDRGSRFLGFAIPVASPEGFRDIFRDLKKEHPKAAHHCFAYRLGTSDTLFRANDDGEPSGSAGRPILGQIDSRGLTDTAVIVVRYFGGTLLGVPGLIHAYKTAAFLSLEKCRVIRKPVLVTLGLQFEYNQMNDVMRLIKQFDVEISSRETGLFCHFLTGVPAASLPAFLVKIKELPAVQIN